MEHCQARQAIDIGEPISFIHHTDDGPVHLLVKASKARWKAIHWGRQEAGVWTFNTLQEANEHVLRFFQRLYFAHKCSSACGPVDSIDRHKAHDRWGMIRD